MTGTVQWFSAEKGYGFITGVDDTTTPPTSLNVFVHYTAILVDGFKSLKKGDTVEFDCASNDSGRYTATNVKIVASAKHSDKTDKKASGSADTAVSA